MPIPKCLELPGRLWSDNEVLETGDWLASTHMRTMLGWARDACTEDPLPIVIFSTSRSLEAIREHFNPDDSSFLSFVWRRLRRDLEQYQAAAHRLRVVVATYGEVLVTLGPPNVEGWSALDVLKATDRQLVKFAAIGVTDAEITSFCQCATDAIVEARIRFLKALPSSLVQPSAFSRDDMALALRCLTGGQLAAVVLRAAGIGIQEIAQLLSVDPAVATALLHCARETLHHSRKESSRNE